VLERWLDDPIAPVASRVPLTFSTLEPAQIEEYLRIRSGVPGTQLEERLTKGDQCFVARFEGRIVSVSWIARGEHFIPGLRYRYAVRPSEIYLYDSFTAPTFRGRAIAPALGVHVLEQLRGANVTRVTMAVTRENVSNRRARAKTGFRVCGRIDSFRIGRRTWNWHRERRSERRPIA
jgi:GNAT superfamily N-acetyltransferase